MKNETHTESDSEKKAGDYTIQPKADLEASRLETPASVQEVMSKIEQAQLLRAREDINIQLSDIKKSVQGVIHRYTFDEFAETGKTMSLSEYKKQRTKVLEKVSFCANSADIKEKILIHILAWLKEWNAILSDMTEVDIDEHHHCIAQMEVLPKTFKAIEGNVKRLSVISTSLLEDKKKQEEKKASRKALWKSWKERVIKRPATVHALTPNQMIGDEFATNTKVSEIQAMLQELIDTTMFNKLENNAINYIASTIENLSKALSSLNNEAKIINLHPGIYISEESEKELSLQIIQELSEENERLQRKLQEAEEKCEQFIKFKASPTSTLKVLYEFSPESSMGFSMTDEAASMDNTLTKEFENRMDGAQRKETQGSVLKWDSASSHTVQVEMTPDLIEQQFPLLEKPPKIPSKDITEDKISLKKGDIYQKGWTDEYQSQKRKITKAPYEFETSRSNLSNQTSKQIVPKTKVDYDLDLQAQQKMSQEIQPLSIAKSKSFIESKSQHVLSNFPSTDTKSQGGKSGTSSKWERLRKYKIAYILEKCQIISDHKKKSTTELMAKESKSVMSFQAVPFASIQPDKSSEKVKIKGKEHQISSEITTSKEGKTKEEDTSVFSKKGKSQELVESQSKTTKETSESTTVLGSPEGKSEQANLDEFHNAIMSFLKEKIDNTENPLDKKTMLEEELLLKKAEVEKLGIIKAKMEEYFQNVARAVAKILRKYKDIKKAGQIREKQMKQTRVSFMPGLHLQEPVSPTSEISSLLSSESMDPVVQNLTQEILNEIDAPVVSLADHKEEEKQRQEEYLLEVQGESFNMNLKHQLQEKRNLCKMSYQRIHKDLQKLQMKEGEQEQQKQDQWQEEVWEQHQKQRMQTQTEQDEKQKGMEEEEEQKQKQQHLEAWRQKMKEQGVSLEKEKGQQMEQLQKEVKHMELESSWKEEEEKQKPKRKGRDDESQWHKKAKEQLKIKEEIPEELETVLSYSSIRLTPRWKNTWKRALLLHTKTDFHVNLADEKHSELVIPPTSTQLSSPGPFSIPGQFPTKSITVIHEEDQNQGITLSPEQAQALGITLTPQQAQEQGITLTPSQALAQGITLTPSQALAPDTTLTPQQALEQGITLTPSQALAQGITLTPSQALAPDTTLTSQQALAQGITLTPSQALAQGITLTPQQALEQGITLTPSQALAQGITLTPQQALEQGITLSPQQVLAQGITLTPQQVQAQGITLTPSQALAQGITLTSQQALVQGITLTPQQALAQAITLTPQQALAQGITLTPQQVQAQDITLTPQQALAQDITLTPQQVQARDITLTPHQALAQDITLTPQQVQALGITLTPHQAQALGITLTPQQVQAQGITLTPSQALAQGITLTPSQALAPDITLTPQQALAQAITLTPQQVLEQDITLTPSQALAQGITLTPQQALPQDITLTPQQALVQGITLTPHQAQALGITLTPQQVQAQGITLSPNQVLAPDTTLTPQQALPQDITLTPQQALVQGITLTPHQAQALGITLTPQQVQAQGITLSPNQVLAPDTTLTPQQVQAQGITLTPEQAQAQGITLTPQQVLAQGITLTPQQVLAQGITLTPQQVQAQGITLSPSQVLAPDITLTPQQALEQGITLTPQQAQALGITLTPQQAQAQGITLTPEQAQAQGITLTPQQVLAQGITLTPQQVLAPVITLTPQQALAQGITLTPQQAQALGITLTPQQVQAQGITLTPEQAQAHGITLTPQQVLAQGITLTPQQVLAPVITLTPQQALEQGITLTPQQAQALGITLTPQQVQAQGITLTPEQAQAQGITLTPQQAQAQGITLTPQHVLAQGITLTPQQVLAQGITLTPQQVQAQGITLTPQQVLAQGITLTPQQVQAQGITLTPQQVQAQGITLTPQQVLAQGITLTPQQALEQGITLTPQQAQALGITLTPQQVQAQGITLTHEQFKALMVTLTLEKSQGLGVTLTHEQVQALRAPVIFQQEGTLRDYITPIQGQTPKAPAQAHDMTLTPEQSQGMQIPVTTQQAQILGVPITQGQDEALGVTITPQQAEAQAQARALMFTLTPENARIWGITHTNEQAPAVGITLTPEQKQVLGVPLTLDQAQALETPLTAEQAWKLGVAITPEMAQEVSHTLFLKQGKALGIEQAQSFGTPLTLNQAQALRIPNAWLSIITRRHERSLGAPLTSDKAHVLGPPLTHEQVQPSGAPFTPGQAQPMGITHMSKQSLEPRAPPINEQFSQIWAGPSSGHTQEVGIFSISDKSIKPSAPHMPRLSTRLAPSTLKPFQESKTSLLSGQSTTSRTRWPLVPSALIDEKTPGFKVSSTSLQTSGFPFTQAPFVSGKSGGKGSFPRELPSSKQTLVSKGQFTPVKFLAPEVPPTPGKLSVSGTPPTLGQPLTLDSPLSPRQILIPRDSLTPQSPLISKLPLASRQPLISGIPPASSPIPSLWAPLFPGKPLIPGAPSVPGELIESGLSTFSEQPQAFQLPTTCEQSPYLQAPSTLGELPAPQTFPGQAFPLRISPTPGHPPPPWAPSTPAKPPKDLSLKSKSALVHPGAPSFKVPQAPFTAKKFQISEVSDTSEEIQELRDSFTMEQLRTFQPYLTKYRTPVSQTPYIDEGDLSTLMKPITSLPPLTTQLPKRSQISPSEWDWKSRFPPISKPCVLTSVSGTKKLKMMIPPSSFQELKEQRYFVDVKAQRKNLILLNQTTETSGHPSELHTTARNLIIETLHTDTVRLGYLFRKYIAYRLIQRARNNIIKRLLAIQNSGKGYETQNLYIMLNRIDGYQKKMMGVWTEKQKSLEQKRTQCLRKMMFLFSQLQDMYQLNLSQPVPLLIDKKQKPAPTKFIQQPFLELLVKEDRKFDIFKKFRQEDQMATIWNADQSISSYPIAEKTSLHSLWAQLGGYPPIPMLLQLDVQSSFRKSLASIQSQFNKNPKRL
uniref:Family with sequence similarity 186 member A n=1 Tax=Myotis myotis TaxID=51298 RepID=A0A7J7Z296_MYOMY|nr:family with sequence similarity 186 member A [Myotis myotis]